MNKRLTKKEVTPGEDPLIGAQRRVALMRRELGIAQPLAPKYDSNMAKLTPLGDLERRSVRQDNLLEYLAATPQEIRQAKAAQRIAGLLSQLPEQLDVHELGTTYVCDHVLGRSACSRMVEVMPDGSQVRSRRGMAIKTLAQTLGSGLVTTQCDKHGELPFPTTERVAEAFGLEEVQVRADLQEASA